MIHQPRDRALAHLVAATEIAEQALLGSVESVRQWVEQQAAKKAAAAAPENTVEEM